MNWYFRSLAAGALAFGLVALAAGPSELFAQAKKDDKKGDLKKDDKKDPKKDAKADPINAGKTDVIASFGTSDGLALRRRWYSAGKASADAVLMFPAPGSPVNDGWIGLAEQLQKKGFSVFLFDWRGVGMNGIERGERLIANSSAFEKDPFNMMHAPRTAVAKGLDYSKFSAGRYKDYLFNDLQAARFALDKQNDAGQCNTNRIWIVSEGQGVSMGLAFIAAERDRSSVYPKENRFDQTTFTPASLDYAGVVSLSYDSNPTANTIMRNALPNAGKYVKETNDHLDRRVAMVMVHGKKEGATKSRGALAKYVNPNDEADMKKKFKYLKEFDNSAAAKATTGMGLIPEGDTFGVQAYILTAMSDISKDKQDFGKEPTKRNADNLQIPPRFELTKYKP